MSRPMVFFLVALLGGGAAGGCGQGEEAVSRDGIKLPRGMGKADGTNSCMNICGNQAQSGCWCDDQCADYGDCCPDKSTYCNALPATCAGYCGAKTPEGCWCDERCAQNGDCCPDKAAVCDQPVDKCAAVTCEPAAPTCQGDDLITAKSSACAPETGQCVDVVEMTSCANGCAAGACKSAEINDPFDPAICAQPMMTTAQAVALFAPGTADVIIGSYVIQMRSRSCNSLTGCGSWGPTTTKLGSSLGSLSADMSMEGDIHLKIEGDNVKLQLANGGSSQGSTCSYVGSTQSCSAYTYICGYQWGGSGGMYPTQSAVVKVDYERLNLGGLLAETCIHLTDKASSAPDSSGNYKEEEYVLYNELSTPTTPPEQPCPANQTLMNCGGNASGMTTCCQMGLTTCPQSGCDCWGACS